MTLAPSEPWSSSQATNVLATKRANVVMQSTMSVAKRRNLLLADGFAALSKRADSSSSLRSLSE
jgi:hypothetical protein